MKPARVLQVVTVMNRGGAETLLMNLYRNMDRSKIQFDFLTHRLEEGAYDQEIKSMGGRVFHLPAIRPYRYGRYFKQLDDFFIQHPEYKVVHSHINENSSFVLRAAKKAGVPVRIAHSHLGSLPLDYKVPFRYYARHFFKNNVTHYYACSTDAGKWLFGKGITDSAQFKILKNGTDYEAFKFISQIREKVRYELNLQDRFVIGHIGRFEPQKNHSFLLDIFKEVRVREPKAVLLMLGDGPLRDAMERKAKKIGLGDSVRFMGVRTDIPQLMQAMDVFLFPSLFEGLPVALIEAQAAGLHCIVSDSVTEESDIGAGLIQFISLYEPAEVWAEKVTASAVTHMDSKQALINSGFDIVEISRSLQEFYLAGEELSNANGAILKNTGS